jgi:hypothetical protein
MALSLASELLVLHNMPLGAAAEVDDARLPASPAPDVLGRACHSCLVHWVVNSSMDAVNDRDSMAHCHMCLQLEAVAETSQPPDMFVMA